MPKKFIQGKFPDSDGTLVLALRSVRIQPWLIWDWIGIFSIAIRI